MATQRWNFDPSHSGIHFTVRHLLIFKVRGTFLRWQGVVDFDQENPSASKVSARIEAASVSTNEAQRDGHLRSPDFFDVEKHPELTFESTKVEKLSDQSYRVTGDLSLHGVTKPVELEVEYQGAGKDARGNQRIGFQGTTTINRKDFGMTFNQVMDTGGLAVSEKVEITIDVEAVKA